MYRKLEEKKYKGSCKATLGILHFRQQNTHIGKSFGKEFLLCRRHFSTCTLNSVYYVNIMSYYNQIYTTIYFKINLQDKLTKYVLNKDCAHIDFCKKKKHLINGTKNYSGTSNRDKYPFLLKLLMKSE